MNFKPINFSEDKEICLKFRELAEIESFGVSDINDKKAEYFEWLSSITQKFPTLCVHIFKEAEIVGQIEAQILNSNGYVNLYSVLPQYRSLGIGQLMNEYICEEFLEHGITNVMAKVSKSNERAIAFYLRNGWIVDTDSSDSDKLLKISKAIK